MSRAKAFGRYELLGRISAGGMAEVFRARDTTRGSTVALKKLLPEVAEDVEFLEMFEDEARIASQLEHPYIARMLDYGQVDDAYFIAFEFVDGKDVRTIFDRLRKQNERIPVPYALYIAIRVCEGLAYAHARRDAYGQPVSIVHRDVSPQNIMVSFDGDVKLIDFGIAKAADKLGRTQVGTLKGKFGYMAPEQVRGSEYIDQRADVFALGICLWELLTSERLFDAPNELLVLEKLRSRVVPAPSTVNGAVPAALDEAVLKALAKNPEERYRSAREFYRELSQLAGVHFPVAAREQIAHYMRRLFPEVRAAMSQGESTQDPKGGGAPPAAAGSRSDLDVFEGLGKRPNARRDGGGAPLGVAPPGSAPAGAIGMGSPEGARPSTDDVGSFAKRTLLGVAQPQAPSTAIAWEEDSEEDEATHVFERSQSDPLPTSDRMAEASPASPRPQSPRSYVPAAPPPSSTGRPQLVPSRASNPGAALVRTSAPPASRSRPLETRGDNTHGGAEGSSRVPPPPLSFPKADSQLEVGHARRVDVRSERAGSAGVTTMPSAAPPPGALVEADPRAPSAMEATAIVRPPNSSRSGVWAALAVFAAIAAAGAAYFLAVPRTGRLLIEVVDRDDPTGSRLHSIDIAVDGRKQCTTAPCIVEDLSAGAHIVKLIAPGFEPVAPRAVTIEWRKDARVEFALASIVKKPTTGLRVGGHQPGVHVYVNDRDMGPVPAELTDLPPGPVKIRIAGNERYAPLEKSVTLLKDEVLDIGAPQLKVLKGKVTVTLDTAGARVFVVSGNDRRELPTLPISVEVDPQKVWTIEAIKPGYDDYRQTVRFDDGVAEKAVAVALSPKGTVPALSGLAPSAPVGGAPGVVPGMLPAVGSSTTTTPAAASVGAASPGAGGPTRAPAPRPAPAPRRDPPSGTTTAPTTVSGSASGTEATGEAFLNINSIPPSSIVLDGKPIGSTPKVKLSVTPGTHTVLFVNPDEGLKKSITVAVGPGETKAAVAKLRE